MDTMSLSEPLLRLPVADRVAIADQLYASIPEEWQHEADQAWLTEAERRSKEMDSQPEQEMSHEAFLAGIQRSGKQT